MSTNKELSMRDLSDDGKTPSHLEKEMYEQLTVLRKQITAIQEILENVNEK